MSLPRCFTYSLGLQDIQWAVKNNRGARKLARTPHANPKKKKKNTGIIVKLLTYLILLVRIFTFQKIITNFYIKKNYKILIMLNKKNKQEKYSFQIKKEKYQK